METASWGQPGATGSTLGNMLVGRPISYRQGTVLPSGHFRQWNFAAFIQDSWKIKRNFTLEAGLRVAYMPNNTEIQGLAAIFDPGQYDPNQGLFIGEDFQRVNGVQYAAKGDVPDRLTDNRGIFWMPRMNFAWDVKGTGDLVVRGGAGVFYNRPQGNAEYDVMRIPPNAYSSYYSPWDGFNFNQLPGIDPFTILGGQDLITGNVDAVDYPRIVSTSLSVAKRVFKDNVFEVGYVGTFGRHLLNHREINVVPQGTFSSGTVGNAATSRSPSNRAALDDSVTFAARPFPAYGSIRMWEYAATSNYHSVQATLSQQTNARLQYFLTYTFSKALGASNVDETDGAGGLDPFDARNRTWGVISTDRTHLVNLSYNWNLPDLASDTSGGFMRGLLNGWQVSGISTYQSGRPLRLRFAGDLGSADMCLAWEGTVDCGRNATSNQQRLRDPDPGGQHQPRRHQPRRQAPRHQPGRHRPLPRLRALQPGRLHPDARPHVPRPHPDEELRGRRRGQEAAAPRQLLQLLQHGLRVLDAGHLQRHRPHAADDLQRPGGRTERGRGHRQRVRSDPGLQLHRICARNFGTINLLRGHRVIELALKFNF